MAQYTYPFVVTPLFLLNSKLDEWQTRHILAPNRNYTVAVSPDAAFAPCISHPLTDCNATQLQQWQGFGEQFDAALYHAQVATPPHVAARHGGFITTCPIHTTAIDRYSHRIQVRGVSMYQALSDWVWETHGPGPKPYWTYDVSWPRDTSCPPPSAARGSDSASDPLQL
jgi:hypothetical protein